MPYELFTAFETPDDGFKNVELEYGANAIFEYTIEFIDDDSGQTYPREDVIVGYSDSHALEEAWYECGTQVYAVTRGPFLYWQ